MQRLLPFFALLMLAGCDLLHNEQDRPDPVTGVLVLNQGNFSDGSGSITAYDPRSGNVRVSAVSNLSSILQAGVLRDGTLFVTANTGNRVDLFDATSLQRTGQIGNLGSVRYLAFSGNRMFVTRLFSNQVAVVNLDSRSIERTIEAGQNAEGVVVVGNQVVIANSNFGNGTTLTWASGDGSSPAITSDAECEGPRLMAVDRENEVWVLCTGATVYNATFTEIIRQSNGAVRVFNPATRQVVARFDLDVQLGSSGPGQDLYFNPDAQELYAVLRDGRVLRFNTRTNQAAGVMGPVEGAPIGAIAYDAAAEELYLGRVTGFATAGFVTVHARNGTEIRRFPAGIAPTAIVLSTQ